MLNLDVLPALGRMKAKDVTRRDVVALLDRITDRGAPVVANRVHSLLNRMFRFGVARDIVATSPTFAIERNKERSRDRYLNDEELVRLWHGLESGPISANIGMALRFMLATATRKGEVLTAEWSEIDGDVWEIPREKSKNGLAHRVPLSTLAIGILEEAKALGGESPWVFPSPHKADTAIYPGSVDNALRLARPALGLENVTPHDCRRTVATGLGALGVDRFIIKRILNHAEVDVTGQVYDKFSYEPQKRAALERWGRKLQEIVAGQPAPSEVVELAAHRQ